MKIKNWQINIGGALVLMSLVLVASCNTQQPPPPPQIGRASCRERG